MLAAKLSRVPVIILRLFHRQWRGRHDHKQAAALISLLFHCVIAKLITQMRRLGNADGQRHRLKLRPKDIGQIETKTILYLPNTGLISSARSAIDLADLVPINAAGRAMNRSQYVARRIDHLDRLIVAELMKNGRMTVRDLAARIQLSSPSTADRIRKLEDCGAIAGYTIATEPRSFGLSVKAHVTMRAMPGEMKRVMQMLADAPEIVEADHVTGSDCFVAKVVVKDVEELESLVDRFTPYCSTDTAIVQSSPVPRRLPKI